MIGAYVAEITNEFWVVWPDLGATLVMSLSGFVGAYMTEEAECSRKLNAPEKLMLSDLKNNVVGKVSRFASLWAAIIGGVPPALTVVVCLTPLVLSSRGLFSINFTTQLSVAIAWSIMFLLGAFLGKISNRSMFFYGAKTLFVGLIITVIFLALKIAL